MNTVSCSGFILSSFLCFTYMSCNKSRPMVLDSLETSRPVTWRTRYALIYPGARYFHSALGVKLHTCTDARKKVESMESNRLMNSCEFQNASGNSSGVSRPRNPYVLVQAGHSNFQLLNEHTPWLTVFLENASIAQLVKKFPSFVEPNFVTVFTL